ncbi:MAG: sulfotransferase family 2 domain-containing protein [Pseudomonadota bacterium]
MPLARIKDKLLFFAHIPKTGGASVELYMAQKGRIALKHPFTLGWSETTAQHMHHDVHAKLVPETFIDVSFTIVRDPMARLMSEYRYRCDRDEIAVPFNDWAMERMRCLLKNPMLDDNHIRPQTDFLRWNMLIFRYEDGLDPVFDWIDAFTGTPCGDRALRKNASSPQSITPSADVVVQVRETYGSDYRLMAALNEARKHPVRYKLIRDQVETPAE